MDEYPKKMLHPDYGEVEAWGPPDMDGDQPYRRFSVRYQEAVWGLGNSLSPLPPPDDEVTVEVKMTRRQRDHVAEGGHIRMGAVDAVRAACRAYRDAEQAEGGTDD